MKEKFKIEMPSDLARILGALLDIMRRPGGVVEGLELECLILTDYQQRNLARLQYPASPTQALTLRPYQGEALQRFLLSLDLDDPYTDTMRNSICETLNQCLLPYRQRRPLRLGRVTTAQFSESLLAVQ